MLASCFSALNRRIVFLLVVNPLNHSRKDRCTYPGLNYQGGDLTDEQGGNGLAVETPSDCASECDERNVCAYWTFVKDWKVRIIFVTSVVPRIK